MTSRQKVKLVTPKSLKPLTLHSYIIYLISYRLHRYGMKWLLVC